MVDLPKKDMMGVQILRNRFNLTFYGNGDLRPTQYWTLNQQKTRQLLCALELALDGFASSFRDSGFDELQEYTYILTMFFAPWKEDLSQIYAEISIDYKDLPFQLTALLPRSQLKKLEDMAREFTS